MQDILDIQENGGIARLTLNRPQRLNAFNPALAMALRSYFQDMYRRHEVRVVILQAADASFCAGPDLKKQQPGSELGAASMMAVQHSIRDIMLAMRCCPQPIISVIQGAQPAAAVSRWRWHWTSVWVRPMRASTPPLSV